MNASSPQAYTIPGVDSMQADIASTSHFIWHRLGTKPLTSTSMADACLPMPVWSCSKTPMTNLA